MSAEQPTLPSDAFASFERAEAISRLELVPGRPFAALEEPLVDLARSAGAHAAAVFVSGRHERWQLASSGAPMPEQASQLAAALIDPQTSQARGEQTVGGHRLLARRIDTEDGVPIGAFVVEVDVASGPPDGDRAAVLDRGAALVRTMLERHAEAGEYRRFIEVSPDPVLVLNADAAIETCNPAFVALMAGQQVDVGGMALVSLTHPDDATRLTAELARALFTRRRPVKLEVRLVAFDGRDVPCTLSVAHLQGVQRHLQVVVHDLSDRIDQENRRAQLSEQLARAQRLDAVGQVAGGLAHDLNNLLVIMVSNLGLAEESITDLAEELGVPLPGPSTPDATTDPIPLDGRAGRLADLRADLSEVRTAVDRATAMTGELLRFAKREDGGGGRADVADVVDDVQAIVGRSLPPGVRLEIDVPDGLPAAAVDPAQLERVLLNLVINARDAVDGDGTITVAAHYELGDAPPTGRERRREDRRSTLPAARLVLEVADDGVGMDEPTRARAFEPLFTTKQDAGGSGLGLATVLAFVDEVDGAIDLKTAPGEGARFTLVLPTEDPTPQVLPIATDVPVAGRRVVVADPGDRTRRVIAQMLQAAGYRVTDVASGEDALELAMAGGVDLVITELALPGITGARLVGRLATLEPPVAAVALAAVDAPRTLGDVPLLVKPFSHDRLLKTVARVLRDQA
ncbi:MAG: response regulator [Nitriliruptoraceae bacterium]|nr:response regulator [Nitriliruptoraceae bacterium]